jgi:lambda family phage portal protein
VDVQRMMAQLVPGEGEGIVRIVEHGQPPFGMGLQLIDADLLDEQLLRPAGPNQNEIRMGVELDELERPVAYYLLRQHPEALQRRGGLGPDTHNRIPAEQIVHLFHTPRIGQTRGVTDFAPVMYPLRMLGAYQEAEVVAARIAASTVGAITTTADAAGPIEGEAPFSEPRVMDIEPGQWKELLPGQGLEMFNPTHPTVQYKDFVKGVMQSVASGLGLSYASLSADLEGTSYASGRSGLLQERDHYRAQQAFYVEHLHRRVFSAWLKWAALLGAVKVDETKRRAIEAAITWQPRGWSWVDPKKDVEAEVLAIQYGLSSRTRASAEEGVDVEETFGQLAKEKQLAAALDITVEEAPKPAVAPGAPADTTGEPSAKALARAIEEAVRRALPRAAPTAAPASTVVVQPPGVTVHAGGGGARPGAIDFVRDAAGVITGARKFERAVQLVRDADGQVTGAVSGEEHIDLERDKDGTVVRARRHLLHNLTEDAA